MLEAQMVREAQVEAELASYLNRIEFWEKKLQAAKDELVRITDILDICHIRVYQIMERRRELMTPHIRPVVVPLPVLPSDESAP